MDCIFLFSLVLYSWLYTGSKLCYNVIRMLLTHIKGVRMALWNSVLPTAVLLLCDIYMILEVHFYLSVISYLLDFFYCGSNPIESQLGEGPWSHGKWDINP